MPTSDIRLINKDKGVDLAKQVIEGKTFWKRAVGLLGKKSFSAGHALWLDPCNNIHTLFMKFSIDVIFVDKDLVVKDIHFNVPPWKPLIISWGSRSAFELAGGQLNNDNISRGDQLYVGR